MNPHDFKGGKFGGPKTKLICLFFSLYFFSFLNQKSERKNRVLFSSLLCLKKSLQYFKYLDEGIKALSSSFFSLLPILVWTWPSDTQTLCSLYKDAAFFINLCGLIKVDLSFSGMKLVWYLHINPKNLVK